MVDLGSRLRKVHDRLELIPRWQAPAAANEPYTAAVHDGFSVQTGFPGWAGSKVCTGANRRVRLGDDALPGQLGPLIKHGVGRRCERRLTTI